MLNDMKLQFSMAGVSRSASVVLAYIMRTQALTFAKAYNLVSENRWVQPNEGFQEQLKLYHEMKCNLVGDSPFHLIYKVKHYGFLLDNNKIKKIDFPKLDWEPKENVSVYKCANCSEKLFTSKNIYHHLPIEFFSTNEVIHNVSLLFTCERRIALPSS
jgi:dual specificity phosphatase 12